MSQYTEKGVKDRAFTIWLKVISDNNKELGDKFTRQRDLIRSTALSNIQTIGIHDYAKNVLKRNSAAREELMDAIMDGLS